jgi:membrane protease YdiL (CAAX protease family)
VGQSARFCGRCGTRQLGGPDPRPIAVDAGPAPAPPGWYVDPFGHARLRYFDGTLWSDRVFNEEPGRDLLVLDFSPERRTPDGAWRASPGSFALTLAGLALAFGLSYLFLVPFVLLGRPGGNLSALGCSEAGLWSGLVATCAWSSHRYATGHLIADYRLHFRKVDGAIGFGSALVARCLSVAVLVPFVHLLARAGNPDKAIFDLSTLGSAGWIVLAVVTCIGAPLIEELFFRGLLQGQLVERFGPGWAIAMTSILFGAAHIANDPGAAGLLLALSVGASGIVLGVVRHLTGRLGASIATHAWFNTGALVVLALSGLH